MSHYIMSPLVSITLNRGWRNADFIYSALNAFELHAGMSGSGGSKKVNQKTLKAALLEAQKNPELEMEASFLSECLENLDSNGEIEVFFS